MATLQELESALIKADAAGNADDAKVFADEIRRMRAESGYGWQRDNPAVALGAGLGAGVGQVALGAQHYLGKGLRAVGLDSAGDWLVNDAAAGKKKLQSELQPYRNASPVSATVGEIGGNIAATGGPLRLIGKGLGAVGSVIPGLAPLGEAVATSGLRAGGLTGARGFATRAAGGAGAGGISAGLVDPESAGKGAMIGGATPGVLQALGKAGDLAATGVRSIAAAPPLANRALELGAPIGIADISSNGMVRGARSILNDTLLSGGVGARQNAAKQDWFNRQVGKTFGADADSLTPEVMDAAKKRLGGEFDRIWSNNNLRVDDDLLNSLSRLRRDSSMLADGERNRMLHHIDDIESRVVSAPDGGMMIPGDVANRFQSSLRSTADKAQGFLKQGLDDLRQTVIGGFNRSVSPEDAAALRLTQGQYKALKTVQPLINKAEASVAGRSPGDVSPTLLSQAVVNSYKNGVAKSPLTELSQIGQRFLVDRTPKTGGSARALMQNAAIGGAIGTGAWFNPLTLLTIPTGVGLNMVLASPKLARGLLAGAAQMPAQGLLAGPNATGGLLGLGVRGLPHLGTGQ